MFQKKKIKIIKIEGMHCEHCAKKVEDGLKAIEEIGKIKIDLKRKEVRIEEKESISDQLIQKSIEDLGYQVLEITEK